MSTTSDQKDVLRRRSVSAQAEITVEATLTSMVIRAVANNPDLRPPVGPLEAVVTILGRIDQLERYKNEGNLRDLVDIERVARASTEAVQVMARVARDDDTSVDTAEVTFPMLDSLIGLRGCVSVDFETHTVTVTNPQQAKDFAEALDALGVEVLSRAQTQDRSRTTSYALL